MQSAERGADDEPDVVPSSSGMKQSLKDAIGFRNCYLQCLHYTDQDTRIYSMYKATICSSVNGSQRGMIEGSRKTSKHEEQKTMMSAVCKGLPTKKAGYVSPLLSEHRSKTRCRRPTKDDG